MGEIRTIIGLPTDDPYIAYRLSFHGEVPQAPFRVEYAIRQGPPLSTEEVALVTRKEVDGTVEHHVSVIDVSEAPVKFQVVLIPPPKEPETLTEARNRAKPPWWKRLLGISDSKR